MLISSHLPPHDSSSNLYLPSLTSVASSKHPPNACVTPGFSFSWFQALQKPGRAPS
jgi:hypothetical protein